MKLLLELIRKEIRAALADPKALLISIAVPIAIGSFMAMLFGGSQGSGEAVRKVSVLVTNEDNGPVIQRVMEQLRKNPRVTVREVSAAEARRQVDAGKAGYAVVLPPGFGTRATAAMTGGEPAEIQSISDPSKQLEAMVARGAVTESIMRSVAGATFGEAQARPPFVEKVTGPAPKKRDLATTAHAFSGMAAQGVLFWAIEAGMAMLRERRLGLWRRLRSTPVSPTMLLLGRLLAGALRALLILVAVVAFGALVFRFPISGSLIGLGLVLAASSLMASAFGLFVASLGRTEQQSRGLTVLAVLAMSMLGGAWFPSFMMPGWVQSLSLFIPVRWTVDGIDAMTWRGHSLVQAIPAVAALLAFTAVFAIVAQRRMNWSPEA